MSRRGAVQMLGQGRAGRHASMGSALGPCSEPGGFHAVQPQQAQALPGVRALRGGCLQGDLQARETAESRTRGGENFGSASPTPVPELLSPDGSIPALHRRGSVLSPRTRSHLPTVCPVATAVEVEKVEGEQEAADAEDNPHRVEQEGDGPEGQRGALRGHGTSGSRTSPHPQCRHPQPTAHWGLT